MCKYKTLPNEEMEVMMPHNSEVEETDNEFGSLTCRDNKYYISFKKLHAQSGKIWESVHSGNVNPIRLPLKLPQYTFFRIVADESINQAPKK